MKRGKVIGVSILVILLLGVSPSIEDIKSEADALSHGDILSAMKYITAPAPVAADEVPLPTRLIIPALGVHAPIMAMGINSEDGRMAVPDNYTEVGWYSWGTRPGDIGSAVMGAHVDNGSRIAGVFKYLKNLNVGNDIYVTQSDGTSLHFKVVARNVYGYKNKINDDVFLSQDKARLNLITCYGTWLPKENTYNKRLVVFAELVK